MKLLLISNFSDIPDEHHVLNLLFCEGLPYFHLRKHDYSTRQMARYIERIADPFRQYVVLHSHFELIEEYGLRGAHFTKKYSYDDFAGVGVCRPTPTSHGPSLTSAFRCIQSRKSSGRPLCITTCF